MSVLYDLSGPTLEALQYLNAGENKHLIFSLGHQEVYATVTDDGQIIFPHNESLALLEPGDQLTLSLYANNDMGNVLWQWAFPRKGIAIRSSEDPGSREAKSFIICDPIHVEKGICKEQDPIRATLAVDVEPDDQIEWEVEALVGSQESGCNDDGSCPGDDGLSSFSGPDKMPYAYGKPRELMVGLYAPGMPATKAESSGTGRWGDFWRSEAYSFHEVNALSFFSDIQNSISVNGSSLELFHYPKAYADPENCTAGGDTTGCQDKGTKIMDVFRHNPRVGYEVRVLVNGKEIFEPAEVKMDHADSLRQEYINHNLSGIQAGRDFIDIPVPERDALVSVQAMPAGIVDSDYPYDYLVDETMSEMIEGTLPSINAGNLSVPGLATQNNPDPDNVTLAPANHYRVSSGYRNPERNERIGGAMCSAHMRGRAVDIALAAGGTPYTGVKPNENDMEIWTDQKGETTRSWYVQWAMVSSNPPSVARMVQLEYQSGGSMLIRVSRGGDTGWATKFSQMWSPNSLLWEEDTDRDGAPDIFLFGNHLHMQSQYGSVEEQCAP